MSNNLILDIKQFSVSFESKGSSFKAVDSINFSISSSEILGLIGESGSGKSVASQSITKLISDAKIEGECLYGQNKTDLITCSNSELNRIRRTEISYIFQEPMTALNPLLTCGKQIQECIDLSQNTKGEVEILLRKVELDETDSISKAYPHELSGGQRQRIMIAMALAKSPKLLIADEPTTALDIAVQNEIMELLRTLARTEQLAILFITHDLLSLKDFADKIAVMYHGSIVEYNDAETILQSPVHPYTKALIESRANYSKKGKVLAEISDLMEEQEGEWIFKATQSKSLPPIDPSGDTIIEIDHLTKWHEKGGLFSRSKTTVLNNISFELKNGESLGLIGESGSGKSTVAKILLKIWKKNGGSIKIYGKEIDSLRELHRDIQLVFQDPFSSLNPKHKVGDAILEACKSVDPNKNRKDVEALLKTVGLPSTSYSKYPHEFSGGQRQRICIAKALAKEPKILVLDEAVSALDVSVQAKILNLLNELKVKKKLTYLLISHDMNVVSYFCNKIVVMKQGEVVEFGNTEDLIQSPESDYTRSLLEHSIY